MLKPMLKTLATLIVRGLIAATRWTYMTQARVMLNVLGTLHGLLLYLLFKLQGMAAVVTLLNDGLRPAGLRIVSPEEADAAADEALAAIALQAAPPDPSARN